MKREKKEEAIVDRTQGRRLSPEEISRSFTRYKKKKKRRRINRILRQAVSSNTSSRQQRVHWPTMSQIGLTTACKQPRNFSAPSLIRINPFSTDLLHILPVSLAYSSLYLLSPFHQFSEIFYRLLLQSIYLQSCNLEFESELKLNFDLIVRKFMLRIYNLSLLRYLNGNSSFFFFLHYLVSFKEN